MTDILDAPNRYARRVTGAREDKGVLTLTLDDGNAGDITLEAAFTRGDVIRLRLSVGAFQPHEYDFVRQAYFTAGFRPRVFLQGGFGANDDIVMLSDMLTLRITRDPFSMTISEPSGHVLYEEQLSDGNAVGPGLRRVPAMGYTQDAIGNAASMNLCARLRPNEQIFGLGERFTNANRCGASISMWNADTLGCRNTEAYKNIPFYISTEGYGLFVNSHEAVEFHVGSLSVASLCVQAPGNSVEAFILSGTPKDIVSTFTCMTGPAALPPEWSFGLWYSNGFQGATSDIALSDAAEFRDRKLPCDVMHLDCYWMRDDMWCDFVWDSAAWPDHKELLKKLHGQGYKVCLWINPYVTCKTEMYSEGSARGYFLKTADGQTYLADMWHGLLSHCALLDVTNPSAVEWFKDKLRTVLLDGVDTLKTDFGEDIPPDSIFANGRTGTYMRNIYAALYNDIVYSVVTECCGSGLVWARSGTAGMQKWPVCWSGDSRSCYEGMAATLRAGLSLGMSGVPFWSHDIGGFYGDVSDEVFVRWAQFGLFSSHSRLHGTTSRRPWDYGEKANAIICDTIKLRYRLMPYILKTAHECVKLGLPFIRPLWLMNPDDQTAAHIWDMYYFGEDMLAAPVFGGDGTERSVYLPEGRWTHWFTKERYEGGCWHTFVCPLDEFPLFVREGASIEQSDSPPDWGLYAKQ